LFPKVKMKRILSSILVIGVLLLSACGAPTTAPPAEAPLTPPSSTTDPNAEEAEIQETVKSFWDTFGTHSYAYSLKFIAVENEVETLNTLSLLYDTLIDVTRIENVDSISISGLRATAVVALNTQVTGQVLTVRTPLVKQDDEWKIVLEEVTLISETFMPADVKVTAAQICSDYETNRVAAAVKYEGRKLVEVEGEVLSIKRSDFGDISQLMLGDSKIRHVDCFFRGRDKSQVPIGDTVTVRGFVQDGLIYPSSGEIQILMGGCSLVK